MSFYINFIYNSPFLFFLFFLLCLVYKISNFLSTLTAAHVSLQVSWTLFLSLSRSPAAIFCLFLSSHPTWHCDSQRFFQGERLHIRRLCAWVWRIAYAPISLFYMAAEGCVWLVCVCLCARTLMHVLFTVKRVCMCAFLECTQVLMTVIQSFSF